ncbi:unnamed protein product, partial [Laminaria digitata]
LLTPLRGKQLLDANLVASPLTTWCNFDGQSTIATRGSLNVSSLIDNGTGRYTVNLTNNMANANYAVATSCASFQSTN